MQGDLRLDPAVAPLIEIRNLVKTYRRAGGKSITPVDHVDLTVMQNELLVLLGPSGCGKTTLLRCVAGLERPDEGEIVIDGQLVFSSVHGVFLPPDQRKLSMVFQSYALWPHMTVAANVGYPLQSQHIPRADIKKRVAEILEMVGIGGLGEQYPGRISGGQQQRVALARALVASSNVLLFDEPLSNIDALVRAQLRYELKRMQKRLRFSGLYVTHDQKEAMELGHRIAVLRAGKIAALDTPKEVYRHPPNEYVATFLGAANVIHGVIADHRGNRLTVNSPLGLIEVQNPATFSWPVSASIKLVARPETLRLYATRPQNEVNAFEVHVDACLFSGSHTEVVVMQNSIRLRVWVQGDDDVAESQVGRKLWLSLPIDQVFVIPITEN